MWKNKFFIFILIIIGTGFLLYNKAKIQDVATKIIDNVYVSSLDNNDTQAVTKFIALYKNSLTKMHQYDALTKQEMLKNIEKLLKNKKLVLSIAYNLSRRYIGYMAIDLKTGYCVGHEIIFTSGSISIKEFVKIYTKLLQGIEISCKQNCLKNLIIPVISHNFFYYDTPATEMKNESYVADLKKSQVEILRQLGYIPMQGFTKFTQNFKDIFLGSYNFESAWIKAL